ncbi:hypothetical protein C0989_007444, partial [Termitomyces sp. Mn162]
QQNRELGRHLRRTPAWPEVASLASQSSLCPAASSSARNKPPSNATCHPSATSMGCTSCCVRCSHKPCTSNTHSIATCTEVSRSHCSTPFSLCATSRSSHTCQSSPSRTINTVVKASTCRCRKTSM